jgi:hypothetical protein
MSFLGEVLYHLEDFILFHCDLDESNNSPLVYGCLAVYPQLRGKLQLL